MVESVVEQTLREYAESKGCMFMKFTSTKSGVSDRVIQFPNGYTVFFEVKRPGKKPEPLQKQKARAIEKRNGISFWADNIPSGKQFIDEILRARTLPTPVYTLPPE